MRGDARRAIKSTTLYKAPVGILAPGRQQIAIHSPEEGHAGRFVA